MSDSKIRFDQQGGHTVLYNCLVRDPRLSLKTIGLLAVMKSLVNTKWEFSVSGMAKYCRVGKDAIRNCLKELEEAGYLIRERTHNENGTFAGNEYVIFETTKNPLDDTTVDVNDDDFIHRRENPTMDKTQRRLEPTSDNPTQIKEITQVKENKIPPKSPKGDKRGKKELPPEVKDLLNGYVGHDKELAEAMVALMEIRTDHKATNSERAVKALLAKLDRLSGGDRKAKLLILEQSNATGKWVSVFPLREDGRGSPPQREEADLVVI